MYVCNVSNIAPFNRKRCPHDAAYSTLLLFRSSHMCACICVYACIPVCRHIYTHMRIHAYIRVCAHALRMHVLHVFIMKRPMRRPPPICLHTSMHARIHTYKNMHAFVHTKRCTYRLSRMDILEHQHEWIHARTYVRKTCNLAYTHAHMLTYMYMQRSRTGTSARTCIRIHRQENTQIEKYLYQGTHTCMRIFT
jgi:hypothetical protein